MSSSFALGWMRPSGIVHTAHMCNNTECVPSLIIWNKIHMAPNHISCPACADARSWAARPCAEPSCPPWSCPSRLRTRAHSYAGNIRLPFTKVRTLRSALLLVRPTFISQKWHWTMATPHSMGWLTRVRHTLMSAARTAQRSLGAHRHRCAGSTCCKSPGPWQNRPSCGPVSVQAELPCPALSPDAIQYRISAVTLTYPYN